MRRRPARPQVRSDHPRAGAVVAEGRRAAVTRPVATVTAALVVAVVCFIVLATVGRSTAQADQILARIDTTAARIIAVSDDGGRAGMTADSVRSIRSLDGVAWVLAVGPAEDVHNAAWAATAGGRPLREAHGDLDALTITAGRGPARPGEAVAGPEAWPALGMAEPSGQLTAIDPGSPTAATVVGTFDVPAVDALRGNVLAQGQDDPRAPVRFVYVQADSTADVSRLSRDIAAVVVAGEPKKVDVEDSQAVIDLRAVLSGDLTRGAATIVSTVLATGLVLVSVTMYGSTAARRRDFGRLRALGASRSLIVALVLVQAAIAGAVGAVAGTAAGACAALSGGVPGLVFCLGVGALALVTTLLGTLVPAVLASRRDPVAILRVP